MKFNGSEWEYVISEVVSDDYLSSPGALLVDEEKVYVSYLTGGSGDFDIKVLTPSVTCDVIGTTFEVDSTGTYILTTESNECVNMDTVFVMIDQPEPSSEIVIACDSYEWIDGITYTASNNTATYVLPNANAAGCDSIVTLDLTINNCIGCNSAPTFDNFDISIGTWTNDGWVVNASGTLSGSTGPSDDMTGGGNYLYYETSNEYAPTVTLTSECLDLSDLTAPSLTFNYHM